MEGLRKMLAGFYLVTLAAVLLYVQVITSDNFMVIASAVAVGLGFGNGLEWIGKGLGGKRE